MPLADPALQLGPVSRVACTITTTPRVTSPAVQHAHVLHGDHVPGRHLQPDVVLGVVHDVVKCPHGLPFHSI